MARPQSQLDLCHVPSPAPVVDWLGNILAIPDGCLVMDPCCGTGEAVRRLAPKARIYGVELDRARADAARSRLDMVLASPMQDVHVGSARFGMLFLNPPYDSSLEGRLEYLFLRTCSRWLDANGVLVYIIKESQYTSVVNDFLSRHYEIILHVRFPPGYYDGPVQSFGQTVLVARKTAKPGRPSLTRPWIGGQIPLDPRDPQHGSIDPRKLSAQNTGKLHPLVGQRLPAPVKIGSPPTSWASGSVTPEEAAAAMAVSDVPRFQETPPLIRAGSPPLPLKRGHTAMALASGTINGIYGEGPGRCVAKGTVSRRTARDTKVLAADRNGLATVQVTDTEQFEVSIRALYPDGTIDTLQ